MRFWAEWTEKGSDALLGPRSDIFALGCVVTIKENPSSVLCCRCCRESVLFSCGTFTDAHLLM